MPRLECIAVLALATTSLGAQASPVPPERSAPASRSGGLTPGAAAPMLNVAKWVKGEPVAAFEPGKVYVVEFWATWCGPCIAGIGHLNGIQAEYRDQGLVVVSVTTADPKNTLDLVEQMVTARGDGMNYTIAFDSGPTWSSFMTAAQLNAIPASFVIGKTGALEYIGHPSTLDLIVPKLLDGSWNRTTHTAEAQRAEMAHGEIETLGRKDPKAALAKVALLEAQWPKYAEQFLLAKSELERKAGDAAASAATFERAVERAIALKDSSALVGLAANRFAKKAEPGALDQAIRLARAAASASGDRDALALRILAKALDAHGDHDEAIAAMKKSIAAADPLTRQRLQGELEAMEQVKQKSAPEPKPGA